MNTFVKYVRTSPVLEGGLISLYVLDVRYVQTTTRLRIRRSRSLTDLGSAFPSPGPETSRIGASACQCCICSPYFSNESRRGHRQVRCIINRVRRIAFSMNHQRGGWLVTSFIDSSLSTLERAKLSAKSSNGMLFSNLESLYTPILPTATYLFDPPLARLSTSVKHRAIRPALKSRVRMKAPSRKFSCKKGRQLKLAGVYALLWLMKRHPIRLMP